MNNLRYADDTTLMAESEEKLKNLLMKVKKKSEKLSLQKSLNSSFLFKVSLRRISPFPWI